MSETEVAQPLAPAERVEGIGGWMWLPIVHLVANIVFILFSLVSSVAEDFVSNSAPGLVLTSLERSLMAFSVFCLLVVVYAIYTGVRLILKKRDVPGLMIGFYGLLIGMSCLSLYLIEMYPALQVTPQDYPDALMALIRTVVASAIWIPYFRVSQRVKATFIR